MVDSGSIVECRLRDDQERAVRHPELHQSVDRDKKHRFCHRERKGKATSDANDGRLPPDPSHRGEGSR